VSKSRSALVVSPSIHERATTRQRLLSSLWVGVAILLLFLVGALTGPFWAPYSPTLTGLNPPFSHPTPQHLFGTDLLGRDVLSRVVYGARVDLALALISTLFSVLIAGPLGLFCGYVGGWFDEALMRIFDVLISIPVLIFALLIITAAGPELGGSGLLLVGVVVLVYVPRMTRVIRASALDLATRDFVIVARARGESIWSIIVRELAPNVSGILLVEFGVRAGYAPILIGSLGFLGFGAKPPSPEWGLMISENRIGFAAAPEVVLAPACALALLVIGLNSLADGLARILGRNTSRGPL